MVEMRWKAKERTVLKPGLLQENIFGAQTFPQIEQYKVLECRDRVSENIATAWIEVPTVGINVQ